MQPSTKVQERGGSEAGDDNEKSVVTGQRKTCDCWLD